MRRQVASPSRSPSTSASRLPGGTTHAGSRRSAAPTWNQPTLDAPECVAASSSVVPITSRTDRDVSSRMLA
jgi:hypothetical protein